LIINEMIADKRLQVIKLYTLLKDFCWPNVLCRLTRKPIAILTIPPPVANF